ncbi:UvrD-helicase domain-containing protein [Hymenobacter jeollabukensis]|uniref:UvrD-like helicase ATP-binding domain-containing protein n=1 Tax=Hymenobacter jeollabukensis TaxID=2025313 RepID=A0A5R8WKF7_9BACT|nr:UvrD-helicase domain-containing protein [Hymenobacter jeollabukensis]TLM89370.1 hypothetical protein FDY95_20060 [Hymenobacter jeollabukensis]
MAQAEIPVEVEQIVSDLERRLQNEQAVNATLHAEGRIQFFFDGKEEVRWLHRKIPQTSAIIRNITGTPVATAPGQAVYYDPNFSAISRNSPMGNRLAEATPGEEVNGLRLLSRALYTHLPADLGDIDITTLKGDFPRIASLVRYQQALLDALREKKRLLSLQEEAQQAQDDEAVARITAELNDNDQRIQRIRERLDAFIARAKLRIRPQLDGVQNRAKRLNLLAGPVIIEGGPGTGKTTTLIHRIQYLLDAFHLRQDEHFTSRWQELGLTWGAEDEALLREEPGRFRFRFYSPNKTLKYYLQDALKTERLDYSPKTVTTWAEHRHSLLRDMGLIGANSKRQLLRTSAPLLYLTGQQVRTLLAELEEHLVFDIHALAERLERNFSVGTFAWQHDAAVQALVLQIRALKEHTTVDALLRPLQQLRERGASLLKTYRDDDKQVRDAVVVRLLASARQEPALYRQLVQLAENEHDNGDDPDAAPEIEADEEEDANLPGMDDSARQLMLVRKMLRSFIRAYALARALPDQDLKGQNLQLAALLETRLDRENHGGIATGTRFRQLFDRLLSGPETLMLRSLPRIFNAFRREDLYGKRYVAAFADAQPSWSADKSNQLHPDEADILLLLLFEMGSRFYRQLPHVFAESTNPYLSRYREEVRPVVGVDEASDFTPLQLAIITQLAHPRYRCVTLCGDLMQRLERQGLLRWEDYTDQFPDTGRASLTVSYRQCQALLRLAAKLYEGQMQERPAYKVSRRIKMPFKLRPTYCRNADPEARFDWLVSLLVDLAKVLDGRHIPSLAVLVKDSGTARELAERLSEDYRMQDAALNAQACEGQTIGDSDAIRVFPVSEIKGMEFDGIIFWDADELERENRQLDLDRLMYVAVSRASFYVAVTFARHFPKALANVKSGFVADTWAEQMLAAVADDEEEDEE